MGTSPVRDPVFQVETSHGVFAPQWEERRWRGTLLPGAKARVELPVELAAGAHGAYTVSLRYGGRVLPSSPSRHRRPRPARPRRRPGPAAADRPPVRNPPAPISSASPRVGTALLAPLRDPAGVTPDRDPGAPR
ncbi:hypothetical protein [Streptomyces sp. NPDC054756]